MGKDAAAKKVIQRKSSRTPRKTAGRRTSSHSVPPAKISAPVLTEPYRRERLFRTLDVALKKHVIWIAAPAGTGKTSLVTTYLEARKLPAIWYNIDARDADIANLFHYLAIAARRVTRGKKPLPAFLAEHQAGVGAFARGFFEALGASLALPSAIVIDDYQEARSELLDDVLREAIAALPRGIVTIVISRTEAPRWLARHLASGDVASLGWEELRLTPDDVAGLSRVYRPDLKGRHFRDLLPGLIEAANGWMAALMLLFQTRRPAAVDAGAGEEFSDRLFDYFAAEILDKIDPVERDFLLKTSVAPSMTAKLAARLTSSSDAAARLGAIERRSFLLQRLGISGAFRYHPLFRGFLLRQAEIALGKEGVRNLHRVAGHALEQAEQIDEAMEQFQLAGDEAAYIGLLLRSAAPYVARGRSRTVEAWIGKLPRDRVEGSGSLLFWEGVSCLTYAATRSREVLERAYAHFLRERDPAGLYGCCAAGMHAVVYEGIDHSRCDAWVDRIEQLLGEGPTCPPPLLPMVSTAMLMNSIFRRPEAPDSPAWAERAMALAKGSNDLTHRVMTGGLLALRSVLHEGIDRAEVMLDLLRASALVVETSDLSVLTLLHARAMTAWAAGETGLTIELVREGLDVAARTGVFVWNDYLIALGMGVSLGAEDLDLAQEFLAPARAAAEQGRTVAVVTYYFYAGLEAFLRGDRARALHLIELSRQSGETFNHALSMALTDFAYAQVLWHSERKDEGRAALVRARQRAVASGYALVLQACDLVESELEWDEDRERALASLRRGLTLARERGYHNMFWLRKSTLTQVAARALEHGIETQHVRATIAKHGLVAPAIPLDADDWPYPYRFRALGAFVPSQIAGGNGKNLGKSAEHRANAELRGMPLRLLQAIVAFGGRAVRDTDLIDALWPDAEGDAGRRVFDTTLHRLRRQLGNDDIVRLTNGRVHLDDRRCWLDTWALERGLAEADRQLSDRKPAHDSVKLSRQLLALYGGPLLADVTASWALGPRKVIADKFRRIADRLAASLESGGEAEEAKALYHASFRAHL